MTLHGHNLTQWRRRTPKLPFFGHNPPRKCLRLSHFQTWLYRNIPAFVFYSSLVTHYFPDAVSRYPFSKTTPTSASSRLFCALHPLLSFTRTSLLITHYFALHRGSFPQLPPRPSSSRQSAETAAKNHPFWWQNRGAYFQSRYRMGIRQIMQFLSRGWS
jgi:hypothetical protein